MLKTPFLVWKVILNLQKIFSIGKKTKMFRKVRPPMFSPKTLLSFPAIYMSVSVLPPLPAFSLLKALFVSFIVCCMWFSEGLWSCPARLSGVCTTLELLVATSVASLLEYLEVQLLKRWVNPPLRSLMRLTHEVEEKFMIVKSKVTVQKGSNVGKPRDERHQGSEMVPKQFSKSATVCTLIKGQFSRIRFQAFTGKSYFKFFYWFLIISSNGMWKGGLDPLHREFLEMLLHASGIYLSSSLEVPCPVPGT